MVSNQSGLGKPELSDKYKTERQPTRPPVEKREGKTFSKVHRSKLSKAHQDNYLGVGKSENPLKIYNEVQKEVIGSDTSRLWNWCKDGVPSELKHLNFKCSFLREDADESGVWNGAYIENMQGFAVACRGRESYGNGTVAAAMVLGSLRACGWREARSNEFANFGKRFTDPTMKLFLFHPDFFPEGKGKEVMKTITDPRY